MVNTFPEEIENILDNARYWKNTNILSEKYVKLIVKKIINIIDNKLEFFDELTAEYSPQEKLLIAPIIMALNDLKKEFKGQIEEG